MLRFFVDTIDGPVWRIYGASGSWCQELPYDVNGPCVLGIDEVQTDIRTRAKELTPAEFLAETRGMEIADKALELLAAERGAKCFYNDQWYLQTDQRDLYGKDGFNESSRPLGLNCFQERHHRTVADLLASESGIEHRQQIEEFILSLPVVGQETPKAEPVAESPKVTVKPHVRCFRGDSHENAWCIIDGGSDDIPKGWFWRESEARVEGNITSYFGDRRQEIDVETCRKEYPYPEFIAKLDELLKETGEYIEPVATVPEDDRGDWLLMCQGSFVGMIRQITEADAILRAKACAKRTQYLNRPLDLYPLGPKFKSFRAEIRKVVDVEEVV